MSTPLAANTVDAAALADELARIGVIPADRLADLLADFHGGGPAALADHLVAQGELTPFQAGRVKGGEARSLALGPYLLTRVHGPGVLGLVYRATHRPTGAVVAVRVLPLRSLWRARQAKQYVRAVAAVPPHPALVPLIDADSANGRHYLVWPLADGRTLAERVRPGDPLPPPAAAGLLAALADGLVACHARKVVHGLVTPQAVGIGTDGSPRLLELGAGVLLAQNLSAAESLFDTLTTGVAVAGLVDYAAPELLLDPAAPTPATDQYGLGAVGYFALTGHPPYPDGTTTGRLLAQRTGRPVPAGIANPAVPPELAAVIDRMLSPRPEDRFGGLEEVREVLAAFAGPLLGPDPADDPTAITALSQPASDSRESVPRAARLPGRDGSDASVEFDLPPPEAAALPPPAPPPEAVETPRAVLRDTDPEADIPYPEPRPARPSPPRPAPISPPRVDKPIMATPRRPAGAKPTDPRASMPKPVQWHTAADEPADEVVEEESMKPPSRSVLWRSLKRNLLFWQAATDAVQVSVFGPPAVSPGQTVRVTVYLYPPDAEDSVRTLSRAFQHDAELIGNGFAAREVPRSAELAVHLFASNAAAAKSLQTCVWRGTPHRLGFDVHVPWESPGGPAPGLISVGRDNVRIGKIPFSLHILPRKG